MQILVNKLSGLKDCQTLVVFSFKNSAPKGKAASLKISAAPKSIVELANEACETEGFKSELKDCLMFRSAQIDGFKNVLIVGLGEAEKFDAEALRNAVGAAYASLKSAGQKSVCIHLDSLPKKPSLEISAKAIAEAFLLAQYQFDDYMNLKDKENSKNKTEMKIVLAGEKINPTSLKKAVDEGTITAEAVNFSRWLGDHPGNLMPPERLAAEAQKAAKGTSIKVTIWDKARIKKEKMGGLLGVSLGSAMDPRFIIMEYNGAAKSKKPVCFVGKGLTFDSGGISIKPSQSMDEMKYDMCGGANVIGTILAIARLKLKINVIALVPSTENMPGPLATKPGDILVARNGKTVEVLNTDAEGRLILMDALSYASELKPAAIFDCATLTGAIVVALGNTHTGVFTRDEKLVAKVKSAAAESGEVVWPMPITDHHLEDMKGTHADLSNISSFRGGGSSTAAAFLEQFVDSEIPWAHFDIAGTGWNVQNRISYLAKKSASGAMIRTFIELAKSY